MWQLSCNIKLFRSQSWIENRSFNWMSDLLKLETEGVVRVQPQYNMQSVMLGIG